MTPLQHARQTIESESLMKRLLLAAVLAGATALTAVPAAHASIDQYCTKCRVDEVKDRLRQCYATPDFVVCIP